VFIELTGVLISAHEVICQNSVQIVDSEL